MSNFIYVKRYGCESKHYKLHTVGLYGRKLTTVIDESMSDCGMTRTWGSFWRPGWQPVNIPWCDKCRRSREYRISVEKELNNHQKGVITMPEGKLSDLVKQYEQLQYQSEDLKKKIVHILQNGKPNVIQDNIATTSSNTQSNTSLKIITRQPTTRAESEITLEDRIYRIIKSLDGQFTIDTIAEKTIGLERGSITWTLARLVNKDKIHRVKQGVYSINKSHGKQPKKVELKEDGLASDIIRLLNTHPDATYTCEDILHIIGSYNPRAVKATVHKLTKLRKILKTKSGLYKCKCNPKFLEQRARVLKELTEQKNEKKAEILKIFRGSTVSTSQITAAIKRDRSTTTKYLNELISSGVVKRVERGLYWVPTPTELAAS